MLRALHLSIDLSHKSKKFFLGNDFDRVVSGSVALTEGLRPRNVPTIIVGFFKTGSPPFGSLKEVESSLGNGGYYPNAVTRKMAIPIPEDSRIAIKSTVSARHHPRLFEYISRESPEILILSGVFEAYENTSDAVDVACVSASARDFCALGYRVIIASETTNANYRYSGGFSMPPQSIQQRKQVHTPMGVEIMPIQEILEELAPHHARLNHPPSSRSLHPCG